MMITIHSTSDVPMIALRQVVEDLSPDIDVTIDERQFFLKAAEPPSWIQLIAEADWWIKIFGAWAAVYSATIAKEAGTATWKETTELAKKLYASTLKARRQAGPATYLQIGLPFPDEVYTTLIKSHAESEEEFLKEFALFVHHLPELERYLKSEHVEGDISGWVTLELLSKGDLRVQYMSKGAEMQSTVLKVSN